MPAVDHPAPGLAFGTMLLLRTAETTPIPNPFLQSLGKYFSKGALPSEPHVISPWPERTISRLTPMIATTIAPTCFALINKSLCAAFLSLLVVPAAETDFVFGVVP